MPGVFNGLEWGAGNHGVFVVLGAGLWTMARSSVLNAALHWAIPFMRLVNSARAGRRARACGVMN
jgi:hypothetical protein